MAKYNGHKNYNHWSVYMAINSEETFYNYARELTREIGAARAAEQIADSMHDQKTVDGVPFTKTAVRAALRGILS